MKLKRVRHFLYYIFIIFEIFSTGQHPDTLTLILDPNPVKIIKFRGKNNYVMGTEYK